MRNLLIGDVVAVSLSSLFVTLSFPKLDLGFFAWVALVPLFLAIKNRGPKAAFFLAFFTGAFSMMGVFFWINFLKGFGWVDFILLAIYMGSFYGFFGWSYNFITKKINLSPVFSIPVLWVFIEYLRSHAGFLALPWGLIGQSQYTNLPVIQIASVTGVYGISFLVIGFNAVLSETIRQFHGRREASFDREKFHLLGSSLLMLLAVATSLGYGYHVLANQKEADRIYVTVVQGNIPQKIKWYSAYRTSFHKKYSDLTLAAVKDRKTDLIVWPESAILGHLASNPILAIDTMTVVKRIGIPLLAGSSPGPKTIAKDSVISTRYFKGYNSAFMISPIPKIVGRYDKIHLLPFGEYLPYRNVFPWPSGYGPRWDFLTAGNEFTLFSLNGYRFGTTICWESIFPDLFRKFVNRGADFMLNIANEAHFGDTAAPYQFLMLNVFRAVENRVSLVRAANTGISCFISPYGEIVGSVQDAGRDIFVSGYLTRPVSIPGERTFYTSYGDLFAMGDCLFSIVLLVASFIDGNRWFGGMGAGQNA